MWWWASAARIRRLVKIEHSERLETYRGQPLIVFAPHFIGLDAGGVRLSMDHEYVSMYARSKNRVLDEALRRGRLRFGRSKLVARHEGVKNVLRLMKKERRFFITCRTWITAQKTLSSCHFLASRQQPLPGCRACPNSLVRR